MTATVRNDVVIVACAVSAGIHAALAPQHFGEGTAAGAGFVASAVLAAVVAVALTLRPAHRAASVAAALLLLGLLAAYAAVVTTGVPLLHADVEPVEGLALFTKGVEAVGLLAAVAPFRPRRRTRLVPEPKGI